MSGRCRTSKGECREAASEVRVKSRLCRVLEVTSEDAPRRRQQATVTSTAQHSWLALAVSKSFSGAEAHCQACTAPGTDLTGQPVSEETTNTWAHRKGCSVLSLIEEPQHPRSSVCLTYTVRCHGDVDCRTQLNKEVRLLHTDKQSGLLHTAEQGGRFS